jgi:hypothetical protein
MPIDDILAEQYSVNAASQQASGSDDSASGGGSDDDSASTTRTVTLDVPGIEWAGSRDDLELYLLIAQTALLFYIALRV